LHHEVSILIAPDAGVGRSSGWQPRVKVSMMNMRPPQQGHGRGSMRAWSAAGVSVVSGGSVSGGSGLTGTAISPGNVDDAAAAGQQAVRA
jgi:hypothetical protein